jgi:hypothetical protein
LTKLLDRDYYPAMPRRLMTFGMMRTIPHPEVIAFVPEHPASARLFCSPKKYFAPNSMYSSHFRIDKKFITRIWPPVVLS